MKCVTGGRAGVRYVITKFSRLDSLPNFLTHGAPLRARDSSAINSKNEVKKWGYLSLNLETLTDSQGERLQVPYNVVVTCSTVFRSAGFTTLTASATFIHASFFFSFVTHKIGKFALQKVLDRECISLLHRFFKILLIYVCDSHIHFKNYVDTQTYRFSYGVYVYES